MDNQVDTNGTSGQSMDACMFDLLSLQTRIEGMKDMCRPRKRLTPVRVRGARRVKAVTYRLLGA